MSVNESTNVDWEMVSFILLQGGFRGGPERVEAGKKPRRWRRRPNRRVLGGLQPSLQASEQAAQP